MKNKAVLKYILDEIIYLSPYILMVISFLFVLIPKFTDIDLNKDRWAHFGGFSIITSLVFIRHFYFGEYCKLTRFLPFALFLISSLNVLATYFPMHYNIYSQWYEIIIFSVILIITFILWINKKIKR